MRPATGTPYPLSAERGRRLDPGLSEGARPGRALERARLPATGGGVAGADPTPTGGPWDVVVLGGGAAGLWAAGTAAARGRRVLLLEKNRRVGVKILASGGGACNLTTSLPAREAARWFRPRGERFLDEGVPPGVTARADVKGRRPPLVLDPGHRLQPVGRPLEEPRQLPGHLFGRLAGDPRALDLESVVSDVDRVGDADPGADVLERAPAHDRETPPGTREPGQNRPAGGGQRGRRRVLGDLDQRAVEVERHQDRPAREPFADPVQIVEGGGETVRGARAAHGAPWTSEAARAAAASVRNSASHV